MEDKNLMLFEENAKNEKLMSVSEVASILGYDSEYLRKKCSELGFTQNGKKTMLNEKQVVALKNMLVPRTSDMKIRGQEAVTRLEMMQNIQRDMQWLMTFNAELQRQLDEEKATNNLLMHTKKTYTASELAKEIGMKSAIELNRWLEEKGIQFKRNNTWLPVSKYSDKDYYEIKQEVLDNGRVIYNSRITQSGREFILKLFKKEK